MTIYSSVTLVGSVAEINLETRDLIFLTATPKGKAVKTTVHMWKAPSDGGDPAWQDRPEWKGLISVGDIVGIKGHLGNNGRVIAVGFSKIDLNNTEASFDEDDESEYA